MWRCARGGFRPVESESEVNNCNCFRLEPKNRDEKHHRFLARIFGLGQRTGGGSGQDQDSQDQDQDSQDQDSQDPIYQDPSCQDPVCLDPVCLDPICLDPVCLDPVCLDPAFLGFPQGSV